MCVCIYVCIISVHHGLTLIPSGYLKAFQNYGI